MTTVNYHDLYFKAYKPYEKDDLQLFKEAVNSMKSEHKLLYMLLLETCMHDIQSKQCCEYLVNLLTPELSSEELILCTISNNAMLREILAIRGLELENMNKLAAQLEESNRKKFDSLYTSIYDSLFGFGGVPSDFEKIDRWLADIRSLMLNVNANLC